MINLKIIGIPEVVANLESITPKVQKGLEKGMVKALLRLVRYVKRSKLTGQPLHVRTGRLRRSIHSEMEWANPQLLEGSVGTDVEYARVHEFGFKGTVNVKEHLRRVRLAGHASIKTPGKWIKGQLSKADYGAGASGMTMVNAHPMKMNLPERSFLRSALKELRDELENDLRKGIDDALR